jgi:hypothetical protein
MTSRQKLNRRKHQEILMGIAASVLAFTATALLVMGALV